MPRSVCAQIWGVTVASVIARLDVKRRSGRSSPAQFVHGGNTVARLPGELVARPEVHEQRAASACGHGVCSCEVLSLVAPVSSAPTSCHAGPESS
jgi:hypothetical protein